MIKRNKMKKSNEVKLTFVQPHDESQPRTYVVGDFNDWAPRKNPLIKRSNGTVSASVTVVPGQRICFRYCTEDGEWFNDESADEYEPGAFGADNSVVLS